MSTWDLLQSLLSNEDFARADLEALMSKQRVEDQHLEYKGAKLTGKSERTELSRKVREYITGFANADGGVLVLGVDGGVGAGGRIKKPKLALLPKMVGDQPGNQWVSSCIENIVELRSIPLKVRTIPHPRGLVVLAAVGRSPALIRVSENGRPTYYFRMDDKTISAPEYLINDLVLGRRSHPRLLLQVKASTQAGDHWHREHPPRYLKPAGLMLHPIITNTGFVSARSVRIGFLTWTLDIGVRVGRDYSSTPPSQPLLEHVVVSRPVMEGYPWKLLHHLAEPRPADLRAFDVVSHPSLGTLAFALDQAETLVAQAALYVVAEGSPPDWYQLKVTVGRRAIEQMTYELDPGEVSLERVVTAPSVAVQVVAPKGR